MSRPPTATDDRVDGNIDGLRGRADRIHDGSTFAIGLSSTVQPLAAPALLALALSPMTFLHLNML